MSQLISFHTLLFNAFQGIFFSTPRLDASWWSDEASLASAPFLCWEQRWDFQKDQGCPAGRTERSFFFSEKWGEGRRMIVMLTLESVVSDMLSLGGSLWMPKRTTRMTPIASWQNKHKFLGVVAKPVHPTGNYQKIVVRTLRVHGWSVFIPFKSWCYFLGVRIPY